MGALETASPFIGGFGNDVTYVENAGGLAISTTATVADGDSANFNNGKLIVRLLANAQSSDQLTIRTLGNISTNAAAEVLFGGVKIGAFTGGGGTTPLVITFVAAATPGKVQSLLRNIVFSNESNNPSANPRTVRAQLQGRLRRHKPDCHQDDQRDAGERRARARRHWRQRRLHQRRPTDCAGQPATVTDVDSVNFAGGKLTVLVSAGGTPATESRSEARCSLSTRTIK